MEVNFKLCFKLIDDQLKVLNRLLNTVVDMHNSLERLDWNRIRRLERMIIVLDSKLKTFSEALISQLSKIGLTDIEKYIGHIIDYETCINGKIARDNGTVVVALTLESPDVGLLEGELNSLVSNGINKMSWVLNRLSRYLMKLNAMHPESVGGYVKLKDQLGKEEWWSKLSDEEKTRRIREAGDFVTFYHACRDSDSKDHLINGGVLDKRLAINGGLWMASSSACARYAAATHSAMDPRFMRIIKVRMRKKIAERFISAPIEANDLREKEGCIYYVLDKKNFDIINNEIMNGTVFFEVF
ncbi:hypothetical protein HOF78_01330 [Candidatus Woesearchaeota archaeon]|jgi:hypothetical protein|nr:hypothetical protein [Candidatus Woesearchaeota archaeon]MBT6044974.1 hypothetical protein [Candidatus Woesearchaeota archaeon]